jgi:hypothetical protein
MTAIEISHPPLLLKTIAKTWWPLVLSWMLMSLEGPAMSAIMARLPLPEINLAAYGGISFPIAFVISSPIAMLLAASVAWSKDWVSYLKLRKFMLILGASITALYLLAAFTPLYYLVAEHVIGAPQEIIQPGRLGLFLLLPFPFCVGFRRFQQGVMIRFGNSRAVTEVSMVRIGSEIIFLVAGLTYGKLPGIVVATASQALGVICETTYAGLRVRPILRDQLKPAPAVEPLVWGEFIRFYLPLVATTIILFTFQFIGSTTLSRMPQALESLAAWPVCSGLIYLLQSFGVAYNEVVIALLDKPASVYNLRKFAALLVSGSTLVTLLFLVTPISTIWFRDISALPPHLVEMALIGMWILLPTPGLCALQSWYQGSILHARRTRGITESVIIALVVLVGALLAGVVYGKIIGLYVGTFAFTVSYAGQVFWLWLRSRPVMRQLGSREDLKVVPADGIGR